jgi:hypothetical protein
MGPDFIRLQSLLVPLTSSTAGTSVQYQAFYLPAWGLVVQLAHGLGATYMTSQAATKVPSFSV